MNPILIDRIKSTLVNGDTNQDIYDKIVTKYPEHIISKTEFYDGDNDHAVSQIKSEIAARLYKAEGLIFTIDRTERPYRYSLIDHTTDIDTDITEDDTIVIADNSTEEDIDTGYIYIIDTHLEVSGRSIYKIGKAIDVDKRIKQLDSEQSSYQKHTILHTYHVSRPYKIEHAIHCALDKGRVNPKKEGFYADYVEANLTLIESIIKLFIID